MKESVDVLSKKEIEYKNGEVKASNDRHLSRRGSICIRIPKRAETIRIDSLNDKMSKFNEEFSKAMLAFKKILQYGKNFHASASDAEDEDTNRKLKAFPVYMLVCGVITPICLINISFPVYYNDNYNVIRAFGRQERDYDY